MRLRARGGDPQTLRVHRDLELFAHALCRLCQALRRRQPHSLSGAGPGLFRRTAPVRVDGPDENRAAGDGERCTALASTLSRAGECAGDHAARVQGLHAPNQGEVERSVGVVKHDFWPGVRFGDLDDLNAQALVWCDQLNHRIQRTTHHRPVELLAAEGLRPLPAGWAWHRFLAEERRVSWDGYVSYDGVLYGLPSRPGEPAL